VQISRVLQTLKDQILQPEEIIIVDASDPEIRIEDVVNLFKDIPVKFMASPVASVCAQRNIGVRMAKQDWIFLCDDDLELDTNYLQEIHKHIINNPESGAVSGRFLQQEQAEWVGEYPVTGFADLLWRFLFQLSIWGDINKVSSAFPGSIILRWIKNFYSRRSNSLTKAGWPLITSWSVDQLDTTVYSLGASVVRKDWLLRSPYDEVLDPSGIGDNYGVALGLPYKRSIRVIGSTAAYNHRAVENRLDRPLAYFRRVLALHYFIKKNKNFGQTTVIWFVWSIIGNLALAILKRDSLMIRANRKVLVLILTGKNPYRLASLRGEKIIKPRF
jgi:glycosyltransferase involved in cell wall biosynthesis